MKPSMILRMGLELYRSCKLYWVWLISDVNYWPTTITLGDETKYCVFPASCTVALITCFLFVMSTEISYTIKKIAVNITVMTNLIFEFGWVSSTTKKLTCCVRLTCGIILTFSLAVETRQKKKEIVGGTQHW
jgi:hypothetical protein